MEDDFMDVVLQAHKRSFRRAFETAIRTGTALVYVENGELKDIYPPYRYQLVPIEKEDKK